MVRRKAWLGSAPLFVAVGTILFLGGCGAGGPATESVSGTVLIDGKPVEGVEVFFATADVAGSGVTDASGTFTLASGASPGPNKVWLRKYVGGDPALLDMDPEQLAAMSSAGPAGAKIPKPLLPPKYSDPAVTVLTFDVPPGGTSDATIKASTK
ncbi:MAG TPA: hypothetical protein VGN57_09290 [Pirellulaceae bacterium]|nr:hypothetical protein [Pirellulaceae bacterium]